MPIVDDVCIFFFIFAIIYLFYICICIISIDILYVFRVVEKADIQCYAPWIPIFPYPW